MPKTPTIATVMTALDHLAAELAKTRAEIADTRQRVARLGRGTGDHAEAARAAVAAAADPRERARQALRERVSTPETLAAALEVTEAQARALVAELGGEVYNLATDAAPRWVLQVGDETDTDTLVEAVRRVLRERPLEQRELAAATGARRGRVGGAIVKLQTNKEPILNLGAANKARWFYAAAPPRN